MSKSDAVKLARIERERERERRLYELLTNPVVLRALLCVGAVAAARLARDNMPNKAWQDIAGLAGMLVPVLVAADAGVTDWKALGAIAGVGYGLTAQPSEGLLVVDPTMAWNEGMIGSLLGIG